MTKNNFSFLGIMFIASLIVSSYQLPLVENTLNKYNYENNINEKFSFSKNFQQYVENQKINFSSLLNSENKDLIVQPLEQKTVSTIVSIAIEKPIEKSNLPIDNSVSLPNNVTNNHIIPSSSNSSPAQNLSGVTDNKKSCLENCVVLMMGDSVMGDIDFSMQRLLKKDFPSWKVIDGHKVSSGLTNQTYYDWPATAKKLVEKYRPDYVFILLGTNDAQGMMLNGKGLAFSKDLWVNEYSNRVNKIKEIMQSNDSSWYWIGLPVTKDKGFNSRLQVIRDIQESQTKDRYISVESIFGKNDHSEPINMKLRAADGIHLNSSGSDLVAKELLNKLKG